MFRSSLQTLEQFKNVLKQLPEHCYTQPCESLAKASIGQHARHVIELYECLQDGYASGEVCYDKRKRDKRIEQDVDFAVDRICEIQKTLERPDKTLTVSYELNEGEVVIQSNYMREVMYNLEHAIHHEALIKVGIRQMTDILLPESFGVAPSTMQYKSQCAQ
ncbi:DinB family protein [Spongiimicrobium salis]|uniref:DinB family protein n=1 Tax=Spongiimicrobium salis TaxID=1667022 RepID=UPI00374CCC61